MSHPEEILEILDQDGNVIGTMDRAEAEDANHVTSNVLIFIFNSQSEVWVQLRPKTKRHFPGMWDISACGGIVHGESPAEAAARELEEEMGFSARLSRVETFMNVFPGQDGQTYRRLSHLYIGVSDAQPRLNDEVDEFKSFYYEDLRAELKAHPEKYLPSVPKEFEKALAVYLTNAAPGS